MTADLLVDESAGETRAFTLDHTTPLDSYYSAGGRFDSDFERTLTRKWERANID